MNVKLLMEAERALPWILIALLVGAFATGSRGERPVKDRGRGTVELCLSWFGIVFFALIAIFIPNIARGHLSIISSAGLGIAFLILSDFPGTIVLSPEGLEQRYWLRRNKRVKWDEIAEIETERKGRSIRIKSSKGVRIVHNDFLSGRSRLLRALKLRCADELPADFPCEPLEGG